MRTSIESKSISEKQSLIADKNIYNRIRSQETRKSQMNAKNHGNSSKI